MRPGEFNFPTVPHGDTFKKWAFTLTEEDQPIDLSGAEVDLSVAFRKGRDPLFRIETEITNASEGEIETEEFEVIIDPGIYMYDLTVTFPGGQVQTYLSGKITILSNVEKFQ